MLSCFRQQMQTGVFMTDDAIDYNRIYRANMSGGLIGWLRSSSNRSLTKILAQANEEGYGVVTIISDTTNLLRSLLSALILVVTLFLWCPAPGYLVITRRL